MKKFTRFYFLLILFIASTSFNLQAQYAVSGADDTDANGIYYETGTDNGKPLYSNGTYNLNYRGCTMKWIIENPLGFCPEYGTMTDGDVPPNEGWHQGGKYQGTPNDPIMVAKMNSIAYDTDVFIESISDDGSFNDTINILLYSVDNPFTGTNDEDFVASGKVVVSNLPAGLTAVVERKSDSTMIAVFTGSATDHTKNDNVNNLTFAFQNSAFIDGDASEIEYSTKTDLKIMFMEQYLVYGASNTPEVNDTFLLTGLFNDRPIYSNGEYNIHYRGCEWGAQWVLVQPGSCPEYSTAVKGDNIPSTGWYEGGQGSGSSDTIYIYHINSLAYNKDIVSESASDDGSIDDSLTITFVAPANSNTFTGVNDDDFVADGKVVITNLPDGLTVIVTRTSDTSLLVKFSGNATNHNYHNSINNLSIEFQNSAFSGSDASAVENYLKNDIEIQFLQKYEVIEATSTPEVNGTYISSGIFNGKPIYSKGVYRLGYKGCTAKWVIVDGDDDSNVSDNCPLYSTGVDGDTPPYYGWGEGGMGGSTSDTLYVIPHNTIVYSTNSIAETLSNDGTINDTLALTYYYPTGSNAFTGTNGDDFIANGKIIVSNLPAGLTAIATRTSDTSITVKFTGAATSHGFADNINNLTFEFQNSAFSNGDATVVGNYIKSDIDVIFQMKYEVFDATDFPGMNGTYVSSGSFNDKPVFAFGEYRLGYRGCTWGVKWVIVDDDNDVNLSPGYCPMSKTEVDGDLPPLTGWREEPVKVYPHNSLHYSKTTFDESLANDGSIDNSDTLVIRYFFPQGTAVFSGVNNDDFVADGKVAISNLPVGLTAVVTRISDTTLAVVLTGSASSDDVNNLSFAFADNAFDGSDASEVLFSTKDDLNIDFHNEYYIASTGGDFATVTEAVNDFDVKDGDVLILAAETFTEVGIDVEKSLTFRGQGAGKTIVQADLTPGTASDRIFYMYFNSDNVKTIAFENMSLQNGKSGGNGGCIYSRGCNLTIKNCEIANNQAYYRGGAIYSYYGNFIAENSTFSNNSITVTSTSSDYGGGAIRMLTYSESDSASISNCTFSDNNAGVTYGGALWSYHYLKIVNSTFANNTAYNGGGIYRNNITIDMVNVLVANNIATNSGNDIYGSLNADYCLIEDITGATINGANNVTGLDPELSALADNGGSTETCAISATSLAKDAGTNTNTPELDQRGVAIFNSTKDIGAYEYNSEPLIIVSDTILEFGNVAVNDSAELSYTLSAINLTNNLVVTAPAGFEISGYSGSAFVDASPITIVPVTGSISDTVIYVKCAPVTNGTLDDIITNVSTDAETVNITLNANGCYKPTGGNGSVTSVENIDRSYAPGDFVFDDQDGDDFAGIKIVTKETDGDLEYDGINVADGTVCADVSKLTFRSYENEYGLAYATFTFKVKDNTGLYSEADYTMTIDVNDIPVGANDAVSTNEDVNLTFAADDFTFTNTVGAFDGISIVSVETAGDMEYNGTDVTAMDCPDVTLLVFKPIVNENGNAYATFGFKVKDDLGEYSTDTYTMTINVTAVNDAPEGANDAVTTNEDENKTFAAGDFTYSDIEGDAFAGINIVSIETAGDMEYNGTDVTAGIDCPDVTLLVFNPEENENGDAYATFEFKVKDDLGEYSTDTYIMTINVTAVNDAPTVANEIPPGDAQAGVAYSYEVPENTFADIDAGDVLTYIASLGDDSSLPAWLSFNVTTRVFGGTPDAAGSLTLKVTAIDMALASVWDEFVLTIASGTGIDDVLGNNLSIYPNPTNGIIIISIENLDSEMNLVITDITGKTIINKILQNTNTEIDLSNYAKGIYFIQLYNNNEVTTRKIVIE
ncbi:MAG: T9SS type A sorting domain-containing protein [Bacteroidales bacterium]|nr:T9SS type A sorting domain-containing protein [Bacteroidales bacterium]